MLQYGGNTVPYIESAEAAERYGSWFSAQIKLFQTLLPDVPILVIGPSDMARKSGTTMETYPQLTLVRDALKEAALAQDALYWDLFEVMGGEGSMAAWVQSDPPLASPDHIHFTPHGARLVAELLRQSIQTEWTLWQNTQAEQTLVHAN
jgi:lysophospholipase L1-like esterase